MIRVRARKKLRCRTLEWLSRYVGCRLPLYSKSSFGTITLLLQSCAQDGHDEALPPPPPLPLLPLAAVVRFVASPFPLPVPPHPHRPPRRGVNTLLLCVALPLSVCTRACLSLSVHLAAQPSRPNGMCAPFPLPPTPHRSTNDEPEGGGRIFRTRSFGRR